MTDFPQNETVFKVPSSEPGPKKNWFGRHLVLGILFLLVVAAAIVAGIYYWQTTSQIPATVSVPAHQDQTKDWQTYTNSEYGFEFKYPKNWVIEAIPNIEPGFFVSSGPDAGVIISILPKGEFDRGIEGTPTESEITFAGKKALEIKWENNTTRFIVIQDPLPANWTADNRIEITTGDKSVSQILSTFKFTNSTTPDITATWKTYRNDKYKFEISYPSDWPIEYANDVLTIGDAKASGFNKCYVTLDFTGTVKPTNKQTNYAEDTKIAQKCADTLKQILASYKPTEIFCGGIAGTSCPKPPDYECASEGTYPDAGTICKLKRDNGN